MAYDDSKLLQSERMINLLRVALGGCIETSSPAISATPADIELNGAVTNIFAGDGTRLTGFDGSSTPKEIDLSAGSAAAKIIPDGAFGIILVTWNGTAFDSILCDAFKKNIRANVTDALTTSNDFNVCPQDLDLSDKCVVAYAKVVNASSADFVIGTTSLAAAGITDTYVAVKNVMPGIQVD